MCSVSGLRSKTDWVVERQKHGQPTEGGERRRRRRRGRQETLDRLCRYGRRGPAVAVVEAGGEGGESVAAGARLRERKKGDGGDEWCIEARRRRRRRGRRRLRREREPTQVNKKRSWGRMLECVEGKNRPAKFIQHLHYYQVIDSIHSELGVSGHNWQTLVLIFSQDCCLMDALWLAG